MGGKVQERRVERCFPTCRRHDVLHVVVEDLGGDTTQEPGSVLVAVQKHGHVAALHELDVYLTGVVQQLAGTRTGSGALLQGSRSGSRRNQPGLLARQGLEPQVRDQVPLFFDISDIPFYGLVATLAALLHD